MIKKEFKDNILTITLDRPDASNAWTSDMINTFVQEIELADTDNKVRVIIITGAGKHFCAGGDVKQMKNKEGMFEGESNNLRELYHRGIQKIPRVFHGLNTPVIAAINGAAIGAGLDLACMCDIRIANTHAKFGETFSNLGLIPGDGGSYFLQRVIGFAKAMELSLTAEVFNAQKALSIGLVSHVGKDFLEESYRIATAISKKPPIATQMLKRSITNAYNSDLFSHLNLLSAYQGITQRTDDHFKAIEGLLDKNSQDYNHK